MLKTWMDHIECALSSRLNWSQYSMSSYFGFQQFSKGASVSCMDMVDTYKSAEPVSRITLVVWPGVPTWTGITYSVS